MNFFPLLLRRHRLPMGSLFRQTDLAYRRLSLRPYPCIVFHSMQNYPYDLHRLYKRLAFRLPALHTRCLWLTALGLLDTLALTPLGAGIYSYTAIQKYLRHNDSVAIHGYLIRPHYSPVRRQVGNMS